MYNTEFTMQKFTITDVDKILLLTDTSATMNKYFMAAVGYKIYEIYYYAVFYAISNTANPYAAEQRNTNFSLNSKIVNFKVMTAGHFAAAETV